jgi:hypothetical protein
VCARFNSTCSRYTTPTSFWYAVYIVYQKAHRKWLVSGVCVHKKWLVSIVCLVAKLQPVQD